MADRYFVAQPIDGDRALLVDDEAHHLRTVMRAGPGASIVVFDGTGREFDARIERVERRRVELLVTAVRRVDRESSVEVTLAVAMPKGNRQRRLVEKLVELGAARLIPLQTRRSVARPSAAGIERLERTVLEATKQCGRNRLMEIAPPTDFQDLLMRDDLPDRRLIAHSPQIATENNDQVASDDSNDGPNEAESADWVDPTGPVIAAIGPEGGWTEEEVEAARAAGWMCVSLGRRILRVETAAEFLTARLTVD